MDNDRLRADNRRQPSSVDELLALQRRAREAAGETERELLRLGRF